MCATAQPLKLDENWLSKLGFEPPYFEVSEADKLIDGMYKAPGGLVRPLTTAEEDVILGKVIKK